MSAAVGNFEKTKLWGTSICFVPTIWSYLKSLPKGIGAHPGYFEAQLQTDYKPDNVLAFFHRNFLSFPY